jgi:hypothetical protein
MTVCVIQQVQEGYPLVHSVVASLEDAKAAVEAAYDDYRDGSDLPRGEWREYEGDDWVSPTQFAYYAAGEDEPMYVVHEHFVEGL